MLLPGTSLNRDACLKNLSEALKVQHIYLLYSGGCPLAKAGTNALGLFWDQLGGVYTLPQYRGQGLATALVSHLVRKRLVLGRKVVLFVKVLNPAAKKVYEKIGFKTDAGFRISYF
ncbi:GNAT family N-acetyltransferase [Brucepastera parasyntrophica]|uniref:GNAT family N-acetyltransferase n=1 Tax=Brucepastera parasyntrophica TaxID=2880008 RepID=UPI00210B1B57|nr:GNAT family N-acetyltransferase [Brucepastera parasyntrophica]ULQ59196.1 GNAT family N-acetyltransferase [Brucepastera parasyntrophica]